jgi:predicted TIM-barrel fold metal-dependent hydrolase
MSFLQPSRKYRFVCACFILLLPSCISQKDQNSSVSAIPMIDAHSQASKYLNLDDIIPLMDKAGVKRTLLSARRGLKWQRLAALARAHPDRITASVRSKGSIYRNNAPKYYRRLAKQTADPIFGAMAEILIYHAEKGKGLAPEIDMGFTEPQPTAAIQAARKKGWPIILHIEFASLPGDESTRKEFMNDFENFLKSQKNHPVALTHLGQLDANQAASLLAKHRNLYLITSHANSFFTRQSNQPWTEMVDGDQLVPRWRKLVLTYPDRFILAFDNVWQEHWGWFYINQARAWQEVLQSLPPEVAHAVAHKNAEKLWKLPLLSER